MEGLDNDKLCEFINNEGHYSFAKNTPRQEVCLINLILSFGYNIFDYYRKHRKNQPDEEEVDVLIQ